jgi:hypothetical protein
MRGLVPGPRGAPAASNWEGGRFRPVQVKEEGMHSPAYPVGFSVNYPDRPLDRATTAVRIFVAIPILIVLCAVSGSTWE